MKRAIYSPPEAFTLSPLLALLPPGGDVGKLEPLTTSLFARYEKVVALQRELSQSSDFLDNVKRSAAEAGMLKQVLDWLTVKPGNASGS